MTVDVLPAEDALPVTVEGAVSESWPWVVRAQQGDREAFGELYKRYVDTVFRFVYFRVGNRPLAEDLTSQTFVRALNRIHDLTWQGRDLGAWLVTIARNLIADHFKSGRYRLEVTTGDVLDADEHDRSPEGNPAEAVVDRITSVALLGALRQLNPEQRECLVLRFIQDYSVEETAQAMGRNVGAVKALQYRASRALGRLLTADPAFDHPAVWRPVLVDGELDTSDETIRAWARAHHHLSPTRAGISTRMRNRYMAAMAARGVCAR